MRDDAAMLSARRFKGKSRPFVAASLWFAAIGPSSACTPKSAAPQGAGSADDKAAATKIGPGPSGDPVTAKPTDEAKPKRELTAHELFPDPHDDGDPAAAFRDDAGNYPPTGDPAVGLEDCTFARDTQSFDWKCEPGGVTARWNDGYKVKDTTAYARELVADDDYDLEVKVLEPGTVASIGVGKKDPSDLMVYVLRYENRAGGVEYNCMVLPDKRPSFSGDEVRVCHEQIQAATKAISAALARDELEFGTPEIPPNQTPDSLADCQLEDVLDDWPMWDCGAFSVERVEGPADEWKEHDQIGKQSLMERPGAKDRALTSHPDISFQSSGDKDGESYWGRLARPYLSPGLRGGPQGLVVCDWLAQAEPTESDEIIEHCVRLMTEVRELKLPARREP